MNILNIRKAKREGARLVIGLSGGTGCGKTYTALQLAYGLAGGDANKVGLLDTENKRGSLYADVLKNKDNVVQEFWIGDLDAPFSPSRYAQAIREFQAAGVEVLVIDSATHEWEGVGGCEEIASPPGGKAGTRWNVAKAEHKKFMNTLLQSDMHIIVCIRAREKVKLVKNARGGTDYEPQGVLPVQEKNFMFEMTASLMLWNGGKSREVLKAPADLVAILGEPGTMNDGYLGPREGLAIRRWVEGGGKVDRDLETARNTLRMTAENGVGTLHEAWLQLPEAIREKFGNKCPDDIKSAAQEYDRQRDEAQPGGAELSAINDDLGLST